MKKIRSALALAGLFTFISIRVHALVINEHFTNDPALDGWQTFGDTNLFQWDSTNQVLDVTWDSSQSNSYFFHALGATLTETNDFTFGFDLQLNDIATGLEPEYPQTFQVAIGLFNYEEATNENFVIGTGYNAADIVEFDYFPAFEIYNSSITTPIISSENNFAEIGFTVPFQMVTGAQYHAVLTYTADNQTLHTTLTSNGVPVGPIEDTILGTNFDNFSVDTMSINSYSQEGQDTNEYDGVIYAGSILAHGTVNNLFFSDPAPVANITATSAGVVQLNGTTNWIYTLERTTDFQTWTAVSAPTAGTTGVMSLLDTNPPSGAAFYQVRADLP
jgi:hypothetical protein